MQVARRSVAMQMRCKGVKENWRREDWQETAVEQ